VFLNGALLGFNRREMEDMYDEIVEFAELGRFMDQKLKNYSSGMQVRLAFSIAIRAKGDILLLDEVLAVGDSAFQKKCLQYFRDVKKTDKTIVLVTHGMGTIEEFCDRALMLEDSKIVIIGDPVKVSLKYEMANATATRQDAATELPKEAIAKIKSVAVRSPHKKTNEFGLNDEVIIDIEVDVREQEKLQVSASLYNSAGDYVSGISSKKDLADFCPKPGITKLSCRFASGQFTKGYYRLKVVVSTDEEVAKLLDVASAEVGVTTPTITFNEKSEHQKGKFYMAATWEQHK
jgi:ABC-2 type transport system ATP-binding protein